MINSIFRENVKKHNKNSKNEPAGISTGSTGSTGNEATTAGPNPPSTRAGGQDDGSYTNSLKLFTTCACFVLAYYPSGYIEKPHVAP